jgi:hypothetical protein
VTPLPPPSERVDEAQRKQTSAVEIRKNEQHGKEHKKNRVEKQNINGDERVTWVVYETRCSGNVFV